MCWYKSWLETRCKLLLTLFVMGVMMPLQYSAVRNMTQTGAKPGGLVLFFSVLGFMAFIIMAGAGITTQTLTATKGVHGSTQYTLTLPASRLRMLMVRAGMGWLEAVTVVGAFCYAMWMLLPIWRAMGTPLEMVEYVATVTACASVFYSLSVLLATFLHDQGRAFGSIFAFMLLFWLSIHGQIPDAVDIIYAMGRGSPLVAHTMPWTPIMLSIGLSAVLFLAALQVARRREY